MTTTYIDCREEREFTTEEVLALCNGHAKPFPNGYYQTEEEIIERRNDALESDLEGLTIKDLEEHHEHFTCPLNRWEYLALSI